MLLPCHSSHLDLDERKNGKTTSFDENVKVSNENSVVDKEVLKGEAKICSLMRK